MVGRRGIDRVLLLLLIVFLAVPSESPGQSFDFSELKPDEEQKTVTNLLKDKEVLWRGDVDVRQFETGFFNDQLVVFYTTGSSLHWKENNSIDFRSPDQSEQLPGKILYLDLAELPERPGQAMVTVTYMAQNQFKTRLYLYETDSKKTSLTRITERSWELVRAVGARLLSQEYDPSRIWKSSIFTLTIQEGQYRKDEPYPLPDGTRLMSLRKVPNNRHVQIGRDGTLELLDQKQTIDRLNGHYGATPEILKPLNENWRRTDQQEPVRLPPEIGPSGERLAVSQNPPQATGLQGLLFGGQSTSSIEIIQLQDQSLVTESSIGSFKQPVLDLEIPPANPDQLLWIRRSGSGTILLEMVELTEE